jgi:hypothetical protein
MEEMTQQQKDTRKLLKTFGVRVDQAIQLHFQTHPDLNRVHIRLVLEDLTEIGESGLHLEVEGDVNRG